MTPHYRRLHLTDGGLLAATGVHPTMWIRLWFTNAGKPHQRAYTLVAPDPAAGTFALEFALHEGAASDWARAGRPGAGPVHAGYRRGRTPCLPDTGGQLPSGPPARLTPVGGRAVDAG